MCVAVDYSRRQFRAFIFASIISNQTADILFIYVRRMYSRIYVCGMYVRTDAYICVLECIRYRDTRTCMFDHSRKMAAAVIFAPNRFQMKRSFRTKFFSRRGRVLINQKKTPKFGFGSVLVTKNEAKIFKANSFRHH